MKRNEYKEAAMLCDKRSEQHGIAVLTKEKKKKRRRREEEREEEEASKYSYNT